MFSFVGDTVLDPFLGTGTTSLAAARWGRNSVGVELDAHYFEMAVARLANSTADLFAPVHVNTHMRASSTPKREKPAAG